MQERFRGGIVTRSREVAARGKVTVYILDRSVRPGSRTAIPSKGPIFILTRPPISAREERKRSGSRSSAPLPCSWALDNGSGAHGKSGGVGMAHCPLQ